MEKKINRKGRRNRNNNNVIARITRNVMTPLITKVVQLRDQIQSRTGSTSLWFTSAGSSYYNLNNILGSGDFTSAAGLYQLCKMVKLKISINRIISDAGVLNVYTTGVLPMLYVAYFPAITSNPASNIQNVENALRIAPYEVAETSREWTIPSMQAVGLLDNNIVAFDPTRFFQINGVKTVPGQLQVSTASTNASTTTNLWDINIAIEFVFAAPY